MHSVVSVVLVAVIMRSSGFGPIGLVVPGSTGA